MVFLELSSSGFWGMIQPNGSDIFVLAQEGQLYTKLIYAVAEEPAHNFNASSWESTILLMGQFRGTIDSNPITLQVSQDFPPLYLEATVHH